MHLDFGEMEMPEFGKAAVLVVRDSRVVEMVAR